MADKVTTVDEYVASLSPETREVVEHLRGVIHATVDGLGERISYGIPTFFLDGNLVHFAAFAHHIGFYPGPSGIAAFRKALSGYKGAKGSVQFPHDEPLPLDLVADVVKFRVTENAANEPVRPRGGRAKRETRRP